LRSGYVRQDAPRLRRFRRTEPHACVASDHVMSAVAQVYRIYVPVAMRNVRKHSAFIRNALHSVQRADEDLTLFIPGPAHCAERIAERLHWPAGAINFFQVGVGKETDPVAVGRPEWIHRSIRPGQSDRLERIEGSNPDLLLSLPPQNHGNG